MNRRAYYDYFVIEDDDQQTCSSYPMHGFQTCQFTIFFIPLMETVAYYQIRILNSVTTSL